MSDHKEPQSASDALSARLAQLDLENRLRLQRIQLADGTPAVTDTPRRGFGSAQGIAHLRHTEHQRRGPMPPTPPAPPPPPGRFGGVRLTPPLPGIIESISSASEQEAASAFPPSLTAPPSQDKEVKVQQVYGVAPKPPAESRPAPSGAMPSGRLMPTEPPSQTAPPVEPPAATGPAIPAAAQFDPNKGKVIGSGAVSKKPLPALYHASVKAAEQSAQEPKPIDPLPSPPAPGPIVVPQGSEVVKEPEGGAKLAPRLKRFKNPTLATPPEKEKGAGPP